MMQSTLQMSQELIMINVLTVNHVWLFVQQNALQLILLQMIFSKAPKAEDTEPAGCGSCASKRYLSIKGIVDIRRNWFDN